MFPVKGSAVLMCGYFLIKRVPEWIFNLVIRLLFVLIGSLAIQAYLDTVISLFLPNFLLNILNKSFGKLVFKNIKIFKFIPFVSILFESSDNQKSPPKNSDT